VCCMVVDRPSISEFPQWRSLMPACPAYDGVTELDRGLDILLRRLAAPLGSPDGTPGRRACPSPRTSRQPGASHLVSTSGRVRWQ
jgi:hypothetical protein